MSKSLKNFISIKEYFDSNYSSNPSADFRIMCLQSRYYTDLHFSVDRITEASCLRRKILDFFSLTEAVVSSIENFQMDSK